MVPAARSRYWASVQGRGPGLVRERRAFSYGDYQRVKNQQVFRKTPPDVASFTLSMLAIGTSRGGQSIVRREDAALSGISEAVRHDNLESFVENSLPAGTR